MLKRLVGFLFEIGTLRKIPRAHRQSLLTEDVTDNISSHSYRVTHIGYMLAKLAQADAHKVVMMCLFHDIEETRSGDQNRIHKKYVKVDHDQIRHDQLVGLFPDDEIEQFMEEYEARQTLEAKLAKDADSLDQFLLLKEHEQAGNTEAVIWFQDTYNGGKKRFLTEIGLEVFEVISQSKPNEWRQGVRTDKRK
ncbi:MAG: HD domain-containing protein [Candidatus Peribacteria bacterium]|nr:MAG: HD domain-containing protein [Candidatus Peribacteria bacterium]